MVRNIQVHQVWFEMLLFLKVVFALDAHVQVGEMRQMRQLATWLLPYWQTLGEHGLGHGMVPWETLEMRALCH